MKCHNFWKNDPINILLGGDVRYDPFSTLHTLKILLPVSCLPQVAHKAGPKFSCENTCQMQKPFVKKGILTQNSDHMRDFRHLLYFIIQKENYWFFSLPVLEGPFWNLIILLKLRPILGVISRGRQGHNLLKIHGNGE